jgi:hypothetical protein
MSPGLKAGLIGAAAAVVLALLGLIPCVGICTSLLALVLYVGVGVLVALWMEAPRQAGKAAGGGAVAGLMTAFGGGLTNLIVSVIQFTVGGGQATLMRQFRQLPPEIRDSWGDLGLDPSMFANPGFAIGGTAVCCALGMLLAAALGAAGAAVTASIKRGQESTV